MFFIEADFSIEFQTRTVMAAPLTSALDFVGESVRPTEVYLRFTKF